jgi:predicted SAM-dependent methyltransferase
MKKAIKRVMRSFGYDIVPVKKPSKKPSPIFEAHKKNELDAYKNYPKDSINKKLFYNIGAGDFYHPYWTNVDFKSDWYKVNEKTSLSGIHFDLMSLQPLPIDSNSAELVYSSHTVEHITDAAAQNMFNESYRILKKGGMIRVTTPNINLEYRACKDNDRHYFFWIDNYSQKSEVERIKITMPMREAETEQIFLFHFAGNASTLAIEGAKERISTEEFKRVFATRNLEDALNYCTSKVDLSIQAKNPGNHVNWWNSDKMTRMFKEAGFKNIFTSGYGQSFAPPMRNTTLFDSTHPKISLYMEAIK